MVDGLIGLILLCVIVGVVVWLALWVIDQLGVPDPFNRIARVLIVVVGVVIILVRAMAILGVSI
jgi:hypothetical protein